MTKRPNGIEFFEGPQLGSDGGSRLKIDVAIVGEPFGPGSISLVSGTTALRRTCCFAGRR